MHIVRVDKLKPGMRLARPVFSPDGGLLLATGVVLQESYIRRLAQLGYLAVYIGDPEESYEGEVLAPEIQAKATAAVAKAFSAARLGATIDFGQLKDVAAAIVEEVVKNRDIVPGLGSIMSFDSYTFSHSVNVCVMSVSVGLAMGLNIPMANELAMGALLHDIGKVLVGPDIIQSPTGLTAAEWEEVKRHPEYGFDLLRRNHQVSARVAHVAYQHHERIKGQGYPRKLRGDEIHLFARIVAVTDSYDAMTADRVYRSGRQPFDALQVIRSLKGIEYDPEVVDALLASTVPYPLGAMVQLSSGEIGTVVEVCTENKKRPVVRLQYAPDGNQISPPREIDLRREPRLEILGLVIA
ncbi:MAG: HD-GYP domain-containing protein [Firmicutes bacterium]|nr:HD-GYP domain-containing protein [Bacillota bacterium]